MSNSSEAPKGGVENPFEVPFPYTRKLASPVEIGGRKITEVVLRKPKGRDWKRWQAVEDRQQRIMGLLVDLSGLEETAFDELDYEDHAALVQAAEGFFGHYRPEETGWFKELVRSPGFMAGLQTPSKG